MILVCNPFSTFALCCLHLDKLNIYVFSLSRELLHVDQKNAFYYISETNSKQNLQQIYRFARFGVIGEWCEHNLGCGEFRINTNVNTLQFILRLFVVYCKTCECFENLSIWLLHMGAVIFYLFIFICMYCTMRKWYPCMCHYITQIQERIHPFVRLYIYKNQLESEDKLPPTDLVYRKICASINRR